MKGHSMKNLLKLCFVIALASPVIGITATLGTALKPDILRNEPFADAKTAGSLTKNERV